MHRARDSRGRFIAKAKSSIFKTPFSSRHRPDSPPSTPSLKIFGSQRTAELEDSPIPPTKTHLENKETFSHPSLVEELEDYKDSKETIMAEEVINRGGGRRGGNNGDNNGEGNNGRNRDNFLGFPIVDEETHATMKNISPSVLPNFYGLRSEDPETFLFEFEVVCRTYDYMEDSQKLKLFPSTLKGSALKWFMGLATQSIRTWNDMKQTFLDRYLDYCMPTNHKDEVFKMMQK